MKISAFLFSLILSLNFANGLQGQSHIRYFIDCELDDQTNQLQANWELEYTNTSRDTLYQLGLHLWANAHLNRQTPLAHQLLLSGEDRMHFADEKDLGGYQSLSFSQGEEILSLNSSVSSPDIAYLNLKQPLAPGEKQSIKASFLLKIPASLSRLGQTNQSYQMTQWFPKVAVYEKGAWQTMSYLDYGEFYSPFADFKVKITLPENYVVAATGILTNQEEKDFLKGRNQPIDTLPPSLKEVKTLVFQAEKVHDFSWFADKRWQVREDTLILNSGRIIQVQVFHTTVQADLWGKAIEYLKRSTRFFSQHIGEYPYPKVAAVQSPESVGGGMEYPMITLIGLEKDSLALDAVLAHEVGHNWFYGVLASNERKYPWMDEGLTSYYEGRYLLDNYDYQAKLDAQLKYTLESFRIQGKYGKNQLPNTSADSLSLANYWLNAYDIPRFALWQLTDSIGTSQLDKAIQEYFQSWQFKHPQPTDLQECLEQSLEQDLAWIFDDYIYSNKTISESKEHKSARPLAFFKGEEPVSKNSPFYFWIPFLIGNNYDGLSPAIAIHNYSLQSQPLHWGIFPSYGLSSKQFNYSGALSYHFPAKLFGPKRLRFAIDFSADRYSFRALDFAEDPLAYSRLQSTAKIYLPNQPLQPIRHQLWLQAIGLTIEEPEFSSDGNYLSNQNNNDLIFRLGYELQNQRLITPFNLSLSLEGQAYEDAFDRQQSYIKLDLALSGKSFYQSKKAFHYRIFAGIFLSNTARESGLLQPGAFSLIPLGPFDYSFSSYYYGRSEFSGFSSRQLGNWDGAFKTPISPAQSIGRSNNYAWAINLAADLPFTPEWMPLRPYLDLGYADNASPLGSNLEFADQFIWNAGLALEFMDGRIGMYLPIAGAKNLMDPLAEKGNYFSRIGFRFNLKQLLPHRLLEEEVLFW